MTREQLRDEKDIYVERYGTGFILADYSGNRGDASYCGVSMAWSSQPITIRDPFPTEGDAVAAGANC